MSTSTPSKKKPVVMASAGTSGIAISTTSPTPTSQSLPTTVPLMTATTATTTKTKMVDTSHPIFTDAYLVSRILSFLPTRSMYTLAATNTAFRSASKVHVPTVEVFLSFPLSASSKKGRESPARAHLFGDSPAGGGHEVEEDGESADGGSVVVKPTSLFDETEEDNMDQFGQQEKQQEGGTVMEKVVVKPVDLFADDEDPSLTPALATSDVSTANSTSAAPNSGSGGTVPRISTNAAPAARDSKVKNATPNLTLLHPSQPNTVKTFQCTLRAIDSAIDTDGKRIWMFKPCSNPSTLTATVDSLGSPVGSLGSLNSLGQHLETLPSPLSASPGTKVTNKMTTSMWSARELEACKHIHVAPHAPTSTGLASSHSINSEHEDDHQNLYHQTHSSALTQPSAPFTFDFSRERPFTTGSRLDPRQWHLQALEQLQMGTPSGSSPLSAGSSALGAQGSNAGSMYVMTSPPHEEYVIYFEAFSLPNSRKGVESMTGRRRTSLFDPSMMMSGAEKPRAFALKCMWMTDSMLAYVTKVHYKWNRDLNSPQIASDIMSPVQSATSLPQIAMVPHQQAYLESHQRSHNPKDGEGVTAVETEDLVVVPRQGSEEEVDIWESNPLEVVHLTPVESIWPTCRMDRLFRAPSTPTPTDKNLPPLPHQQFRTTTRSAPLPSEITHSPRKGSMGVFLSAEMELTSSIFRTLLPKSSLLGFYTIFLNQLENPYDILRVLEEGNPMTHVNAAFKTLLDKIESGEKMDVLMGMQMAGVLVLKNGRMTKAEEVEERLEVVKRLAGHEKKDMHLRGFQEGCGVCQWKKGTMLFGANVLPHKLLNIESE
ncbi:hypothetical protein HDV05_001016 [Chytridiales sp. JEL 0842]|nr:hypothetical protein HDV05_001016 [Chytridiales sp. JEL 0842]